VTNSSHRGVAKIERENPQSAQPDWDDLRVFLSCAEFGSFRRAALSLGVHPSTVVRRISGLEDEMGAELFTRLPEGVSLPIAGHAMLDKARSVESAIFDLLRAKRTIAAERMLVTDVFDPRQNIFGGVRYLRVLANTFNGDLALTVAAYNAGEGAVMRYGGIPPYPETQDYVVKVVGYYRQYRNDALSH